MYCRRFYWILFCTSFAGAVLGACIGFFLQDTCTKQLQKYPGEEIMRLRPRLLRFVACVKGGFLAAAIAGPVVGIGSATFFPGPVIRVSDIYSETAYTVLIISLSIIGAFRAWRSPPAQAICPSRHEQRVGSSRCSRAARQCFRSAAPDGPLLAVVGSPACTSCYPTSDGPIRCHHAPLDCQRPVAGLGRKHAAISATRMRAARNADILAGSAAPIPHSVAFVHTATISAAMDGGAIATTPEGP